MRSSPDLIKLNGHSPAPSWLPLDLGTTSLQGGTRNLPGLTLSDQGGTPRPNGVAHVNGNATLPRSSRQPVSWQPPEVAPWQPLSAVVSHAGDAIPDMVELRKRMLDETHLEGQQRANQIIQTAQQQAEEIIRQAKNAVADATQQAREKGLAAAQTEAERLLRTSHAIVDEIHAWRESMLAQSESAVLNLVTDIARTLFGSGLVLDAEVLRETFTRALSEAKQLGDLLVHLHPADTAILDRAWVESQTASRAARVELVPDPAIRRGGCLVEGQFGQVDARVETKWGIVERTLHDTLAANTKRQPLVEGEMA